MKKTTRMMMMNACNDKKDLDREYMDRDMESRFRDDRGREHYDNGRYAPQSNMPVENRRDSMGRYARSRYDDAMGNYDVRNDHHPYVEPVYRDTTPKMHKIGFSVDGEMERLPSEIKHDYRTSADYKDMEDEIAYRKGGEKTMGYGNSDSLIPFDKEMAMEWTDSMENEDGTTGPHWSIDKVKEIMARRSIGGDPLKLWVALNATYSDLCEQFTKYGLNNIDAYIDFAKAIWLDDKDSVSDKLAAYYTYVSKH